MISGGGMMAAGGAMALASGGVLAPGGALSVAAGASFIAAGATAMVEHQQKLKQHAEPIVIHEARTLDQCRASGKKPPKDVTLPSGKPDPSAVPTGPRHEISPKWDPVKQESVRGEQRVMDAAAKEGYKAEWIAEKPSHKKAPTELSGNPDNRLEGRTFDIYTPREPSVDSVIKGVVSKLDKNQADRVIINLEFHSVSERALIERLENQPPVGLKEVIIFNDGKFTFLPLRK
jgi:Contact-dependent growth inhibition CdiA C-terminal domain